MPLQNVGDRLFGASTATVSRSGSWTSFSPSCTDCQGSPARSLPPLPSTTPMPPTTLCSSLLPAPKREGATAEPKYCRLIQLATTTGAQDEFEDFEVLVLLPDIVMQEGLPLQRFARRA